MEKSRKSHSLFSFGKQVSSLVLGVSLLLGSAGKLAAQDSSCVDVADRFVTLLPSIAADVGSPSGEAFAANKESRLLVPMGMFVAASCTLSGQTGCLPETMERKQVLSILVVSSLMVSCFESDGAEFDSKKATYVAEFNKMAPIELRLGQMIMATKELGGTVSEDNRQIKVEIAGEMIEVNLIVESNQ